MLHHRVILWTTQRRTPFCCRWRLFMSIAGAGHCLIAAQRNFVFFCRVSSRFDLIVKLLLSFYAGQFLPFSSKARQILQCVFCSCNGNCEQQLMFVCIKTRSHFRVSVQTMDQAKPKSTVCWLTYIVLDMWIQTVPPFSYAAIDIELCIPLVSIGASLYSEELYVSPWPPYFYFFFEND